MIWDNIPQELKVNAVWCCWKLTDGKKLPYDVVTGSLARSNDKSTFHSFSTALGHVHKYLGYDENGKATGGLGLGIFNGYSAIDIDHCVTDGVLSDLAQEIVDYIQSYTEISPSGTGVRIIFKTDTEIEKNTHYINNRKNGLEIYISENTNKFVTITGRVIFPASLNHVDIQELLDKHMRKSPTVATAVKPSDVIITDGYADWSALQEAVTRDKKLHELWHSTAPGSNADESERDLGLCNKLAYYLNCNTDAIRMAFEMSPYYKSKDDAHIKKWSNPGYSDVTISKAVTAVSSAAKREKVPEESTDLHDTGNAHRFVNKFGDIVRYNVDNKCWMIWNGKYWQPDVFNNVKNLAEVVIELMRQQAVIADNENERKAILQNIKRALQSAGKEALLREAMHLPGVPVNNHLFDTDNWKINTESGIIDLQTGKITQHDITAMHSKFIPLSVSYDKPVRWLKFLSDIFDGNNEMIEYVHKIMGYSLSGSTREQCMFMFIGDGSNGKSILLEVVNKALGDYGAYSNSEVLLDKKNAGAGNLGDIARLNKIRNVVTSETQIGDKLNESAIKTMTSGIEKIVARFLYGNEFEFTPIFKIFMATNHKPIIRGTDNGIWRRIRIVPFNVVFDEKAQDKDLVNKLSTELPQILGWLIDGCLKWQKEGLHSPKMLDDATREYRSEMDIVQRWLNEACELDARYKEKSTDLFNNLCNYTAANREFQISNTLFGRNMSKKFKKLMHGGATYYVGIKLRENNEFKIDKKRWDEI